MATISEDVLLQIPNVKHKKDEGTLYAMSERLAFFLENRETVSVSHMYADIKTQKISAESKSKVQLQLVFHDGSSSTFQFVRSNRTEAIGDRDKLKDLLFKILPKFQKKVNKELREKNRLLSENPLLFQLYRDLVITQVVPAEEFWLRHAPYHVSSRDSTSSSENVGVPSNFLVDLKTDGFNNVNNNNTVKYNLNFETIQCIFKTYPAVRKKHLEYVPDKLNESEFWKKFFESHYFHKDRTVSKDLFADCSEQDDRQLKKDVDTLLNDDSSYDLLLATVEDDDYLVDEQHDQSTNTTGQTLIKRFNQHSINVLKTCKDTKKRHNNNPLSSSIDDDNKLKNDGDAINHNNHNNSNTTNNHINNSNINNSYINDINNSNMNDINNSNINNSTVSNKRKLKVIDNLLSDEISDDDSNDYTNNDGINREKSYILSRLSNVEYCSSSSSADMNNSNNNDNRTSYLTTTDQMNTSSSTWSTDRLKTTNARRELITDEVEKWSKRRTIYPIHPTAAVNALGDLTPNRNVNLSSSDHKSSLIVESIPVDIREEFQNLYVVLSELLRRFWSCVPPITPNLEEELTRTYEALRKLQAAKLIPFEQKILLNNSRLNQISSHLNLMLTTAYDKYVRWQRLMN